MPSNLSGGMKKRVGLARAIVPSPRYMLYDEPTTGLDMETADEINVLINELRTKLGVTSIVVTHDIHSAFVVGDRFAILDGGTDAHDRHARRNREQHGRRRPEVHQQFTLNIKDATDMKWSNEARIGIGVLAAAVIFIVGVVYLRGIDLRSKQYALNVFYRNVNGLKEGDVVTVAGLAIGRVEIDGDGRPGDRREPLDPDESAPAERFEGHPEERDDHGGEIHRDCARDWIPQCLPTGTPLAGSTRRISPSSPRHSPPSPPTSWGSSRT